MKRSIPIKKGSCERLMVRRRRPSIIESNQIRDSNQRSLARIFIMSSNQIIVSNI